MKLIGVNGRRLKMKLIKLDQLEIDPKLLVKLEKDSGKLVLTPKAEKLLTEFLEFKNKIKEAKKQLERAEEIIKGAFIKAIKTQSETPNLSGIIGRKIRVIFSEWGSKFSFTDPEVARPFLNENIRYTVNSKLVEQYEREYGELPPGVIRVARKKVMQIKENKLQKLLKKTSS